MKKIILVLVIFILGVVVGYFTTIETTKVDIVDDTETGAIISIDSFGNVYTYYVEK